MAKSKTTTTFEDDFDEEEKLSPEDQAAWDEMEEYFSESLHQFKEGQVIQGTIRVSEKRARLVCRRQDRSFSRASRR